MRISLIAALDQSRGIGKNNKLPWRIPEDLKRFREITRGHPVIMGRKTFESIGKVLPERINIIVTHDSSYKAENCVVCHKLEEAIKVAKQAQGKTKEIFIIGGGQIFEQGISLADKLYLTVVEGEFGADTFFPDYSDFKKVVREESRQSGQYKYRFMELERE